MNPNIPRQGELFHEPGQSRPVARVRRGFDSTVGALRDVGRLEPVDAALVALGRTLADALDLEHTGLEPSPYTEATVARALMAVVLELRGGPASDVDADTIGALFNGAFPHPSPP